MSGKSDDGVYVWAGSIYTTTSIGQVFKICGNPTALRIEAVDRLPSDAIPLKRPLTARDWDADDYKAAYRYCAKWGYTEAAMDFESAWKYAESDDELNALAEKLYTVAGGETIPFDARTIHVQNEWRAKARHWQEINK